MLGSLGTVLLFSALSSTNPGATGYFYLQEGGYVAGEVLSDDGNQVRIRMRDSGEVQSLVYDAFTDRTQYKLRAMEVESGAEHVGVAAFALGHGLFRKARVHYRAALRNDPSLLEVATAGLERVHVAESMTRLDQVVRDLEAGAFDDAHRTLVELSGDRNKEVSSRALALMESFPDMTQSRPYVLEHSFPDLAKIQRLYDRAVEHNRDGLLHTRSGNRSSRDYRSATKDVRRALAMLERYRDKHRGNGLFQRAALDMERNLLELFATIAMNQSSLHIVQQSFRRALTVLNEALAYDPLNAKLLSARARVEQAVSYASGGVLVGTL